MGIVLTGLLLISLIYAIEFRLLRLLGNIEHIG